MRRRKSILGIVFSKLGGLLLFLIILAIANILAIIIESNTFRQLVGFMNNNLGIIILFSAIFFLAELFSIIMFPFNIPYPIFNAAGSIYLIIFIFRFLGFIESFGPKALTIMAPLKNILLLLVPIVVLAIGYVKIFSNEINSEKRS